MSIKVTRRNFLAGSAAAAAAAALAGCNAAPAEAPQAEAAPDDSLPALEDYPIDPDGADVEALWSSEKLRKDGWFKVTNPEGATLGVMDEARIIQVAGLAFRDMNGNGKLDAWEDWRQDAMFRANALAAVLTPEDCFPLLWAGGTQALNMITDKEAFDQVEAGSRAGVSRLNSNPDSYPSDVAWINNVQAVCEKSALGIPYLNYSDPYRLFGVPSSAGLAAAMDKDLWRKAGMFQARAWRSVGVRCELGPQVDVYSNPIGTRLSGAVTEDPALARDFTAAFGGGMQSTWGDDEATEDLGWGPQSCGVMLKHFAGEGSNEGGRNDHNDTGKWNVFPGSNFNAHLIPFLDGGMRLDSKTQQMLAVMPCYGIAYDPNDDSLGEHVGSAYSNHNISILRNAGWDGLVCTDWDILSFIPHGVGDLSEPERYAKLMENTVSQHGGTFQPDIAKEAFDIMSSKLGEEEALAVMQRNASFIFGAMVRVDLFDNPYSEVDVAKEAMESEAANAFGVEAADKCVVMLKNEGTVSEAGLGDRPKVYIPQKFTPASQGFFGNTPASFAMCIDDPSLAELCDVVTDAIGDPTGDPFEGEDQKQFQLSDMTRLTAEDLADVSYAIVKVNNPADAFQGCEGGKVFNPMATGDEEYPPAVYRPITLQYRPYTADADYVRAESLNPEDEFGVYENRSVKGNDTYATNEDELDLVLDIRSKLPEGAKLILVIDADRPMVFSEIEPSADVILMGFNGLPDAAYAHIATGQVEPSGLLPYQMPKDMQTVMEQYEDVPRDMECYVDAAGNTYDFTFGLNWQGKIDDERVKRYSVVPITQPETEVVAD